MLRDRSALRAIPFDYSRPLPSPPTNHRGRADRHYDVIAPPLGTYAGNLESDSTPKELFVMHTAGQDGMGSSSYIDSFVLRDADLNASGGFGGASDGTLEDRKYCLQNWRADVVALARTDGYLAEQIRYSAYGTPTSFHPVDIADDAGNPLPSTGVNNGVDSGDYNLFWAVYFLDPPDNAPADVGDEYGGSLPSWGLNNGVNEGDYNFFGAAFFDYRSFGRGVLSDGPTANNRLGYAGYEYDPILTGGYYQVRHRVYDSGNGRWTRRDPLGCVDGMGLYAYVATHPIRLTDPAGLRKIDFAVDAFINGARRGPWLPEPFSSLTGGWEFKTDGRDFGQYNWNLAAPNARLAVQGWTESCLLGTDMQTMSWDAAGAVGASTARRQVTRWRHGRGWNPGDEDDRWIQEKNAWEYATGTGVGTFHFSATVFPPPQCITEIRFTASASYPLSFMRTPSIDFSGSIRYEAIAYDLVQVDVALTRNLFPDYEGYIDHQLEFQSFSDDDGPGAFPWGNLGQSTNVHYTKLVAAPTPNKCLKSGSCDGTFPNPDGP